MIYLDNIVGSYGMPKLLKTYSPWSYNLQK